MEIQNNQPMQNNVSEPQKPLNDKVLWLMFLIAIFAYNGVAIFIASNPEMGFGANGFAGLETEIYSLIFYAFIIISAINFIVILKLKNKAEKKELIVRPSSKSVNYNVLRFAFAESMAIFGIMLFLVNGIFNDLYLFSALAIVAMLLVYPKN